MSVAVESILDTLLEEVWFELTFLLAVSLIAAFLFTRFGQPKVIGYIVIGVVIGPSALGIIQAGEGGTSGLPDTIMMLAELGSIILLFMIGLECDLREIYTRKSILIALGGVSVPWVAGYAVALLFGYEADAIFIGATLVATSVAVTASVLSELGLIGTPVAYAIVGAAVVDDVLGMVVLGVSKGITQGDLDTFGLGLLIVGAVLFITIGAYIGSRFLAKLVFDVQISGYRRKMPMSGFILALAIAFMYSFVAEAIQISAIVGAFVAGTAFSGSALRDGFRKGTQYLEALFVPLFFVSLGTAVDLTTNLWETVVFGLVLTGAALASKVVGCAIPARLTGMSRWDSVSVGVGMMPRLEIAFIIAYYGLSTSIIGAGVYSVVVLMGLLTALFTPPILKYTLKRGGHKPFGI
jgi:Kef-type K+ transport system membrane component KefB